MKVKAGRVGTVTFVPLFAMSACDIYYKFSVRLMSFLGLWPYDSESTRRAQATFVNICCSLLVIVQITPIITSDLDIMALLQSICTILMVAGAVVKFNAYLFLTSTIRYIMDSVMETWTTTHKGTLEILRRRAALGKQQGAIYAIFIYPSALLLILYRWVSYFMIVTAPANTTEVFYFPVVTDYLVEEEKYLSYIVIHQSVSLAFIATIYVATESLYIMWLQHSIGLYELVSYNIQQGIIVRPFYVSVELMEMYGRNCLANAVAYHSKAHTYSTPWYDASVFIQKQLLLIITRCNERFVFDFYGFYNASIEGFSGLVRCTMSYFMMMTSLQ
ncbi:uncharacterized protein LOC144467802 isoform X2 [Augochlora pura]